MFLSHAWAFVSDADLHHGIIQRPYTPHWNCRAPARSVLMIRTSWASCLQNITKSRASLCDLTIGQNNTPNDKRKRAFAHTSLHRSILLFLRRSSAWFLVARRSHNHNNKIKSNCLRMVSLVLWGYIVFNGSCPRVVWKCVWFRVDKALAKTRKLNKNIDAILCERPGERAQVEVDFFSWLKGLVKMPSW